MLFCHPHPIKKTAVSLVFFGQHITDNVNPTDLLISIHKQKAIFRSSIVHISEM